MTHEEALNRILSHCCSNEGTEKGTREFAIDVCCTKLNVVVESREKWSEEKGYAEYNILSVEEEES